LSLSTLVEKFITINVIWVSIYPNMPVDELARALAKNCNPHRRTSWKL